MQSDHPPYPRPVPHIDCDEDILLPGAAVIFQNDHDENSDVEQIAAKRAAKRRRIQRHAHAYLRGQGISILSAGLRGPFNKNWGNPWVKLDRSTRAANGVRESGQYVQDARLDVSAPDPLSELGKSTSVKTPVLNIAPLVNPFLKATNLSEPPHSNEKVEGWLRRNSALHPQNNFTAPLSPTPKAKSSPIQRRQDPKYRWTPTKQLITVNSQDLRAPVHVPLPSADNSSETEVQTKKVDVAPKNAHSRLQKALQSQTEYRALFHEFSARSPPVLAKVVTNPDRAEAEILRIKHHSNEDETSMSSDKQPFESILYREVRSNEKSNKLKPESNSLVTPPVSDQEQTDKPCHRSQSTYEKGKQTLAAPEICSQPTHTPWKSKLNHIAQTSSQPIPSRMPSSNTQFKNFESAGNRRLSLIRKGTIASQADTSECPIPALSTSASDAQFNQLPPSAQHKPDLRAMPSNASSSIRLLEALSTAISLPHEEEEGSDESKKQDLEQSNVPFSNEVHSQTGMNPTRSELSENRQQSQDIKLVDSPVKEATRSNSVDNSIPQESNNQISKAPEGYSPHDYAVPLQLANHNMQTNNLSTKQKGRRSKEGRKASFAPEASSMSSNESIKSALKVRKNDTGTSRILKSPPPSFKESNVDKNDLEGENSMQSSLATSSRIGRKLSTPYETSGGKRGILKNTSGPPLASRQQASNPGIEEDDFDLNGAIDELGSFLSTWDAEKDGLKVV